MKERSGKRVNKREREALANYYGVSPDDLHIRVDGEINLRNSQAYDLSRFFPDEDDDDGFCAALDAIEPEPNPKDCEVVTLCYGLGNEFWEVLDNACKGRGYAA